MSKDDRLTRGEALHSDLMLSHRRCGATSKRTGEPCKNYALLGMRVCRMHGGATRRSKTAAARRIAQASGYAAEMLVEFMADPKVDMKTRTQIAQDLLNRAGVSGKQELEVQVKKYEHVLDYILVDVEEPGDDFDAKVIDAEVVEDDDADRDNEIAERQVGRAKARRKGAVVEYDRQNPRIPPSDSQEARELNEARKKQQRMLRETDGRSRNGRATMRRK